MRWTFCCWTRSCLTCAALMCSAIWRNLAERELRRHHAFNASVLHASGAIMLIANAAGRVVQCNRAFEQAAGRPGEEVRGRQLGEFLPPALLIGCSPKEFEHVLPPREGERRLVLWSLTTQPDAAGSAEFII